VVGPHQPIDVSPALRTDLFTGEPVKYKVEPATGAVTCKDPDALRLAQADRECEGYVAMTRAKKLLTFLFDPEQEREFLTLNPEIGKLFAGAAATRHPQFPDVEILEYSP
jgi:DNA helicase-2/ATP-dependent DNA helicase PcrA